MIKRLYQAVVPQPAREGVYQFIERIEWIWHLGNSVECPCCGATWRKFLPHGRPLRYNSRCARCGSLERHRLIYSYLESKLLRREHRGGYRLGRRDGLTRLEIKSKSGGIYRDRGRAVYRQGYWNGNRRLIRGCDGDRPVVSARSKSR